jgi:hypothetical protein
MEVKTGKVVSTPTPTFQTKPHSRQLWLISDEDVKESLGECHVPFWGPECGIVWKGSCLDTHVISLRPLVHVLKCEQTIWTVAGILFDCAHQEKHSFASLSWKMVQKRPRTPLNIIQENKKIFQTELLKFSKELWGGDCSGQLNQIFFKGFQQQHQKTSLGKFISSCVLRGLDFYWCLFSQNTIPRCFFSSYPSSRAPKLSLETWLSSPLRIHSKECDDLTSYALRFCSPLHFAHEWDKCWVLKNSLDALLLWLCQIIIRSGIVLSGTKVVKLIGEQLFDVVDFPQNEILVPFDSPFDVTFWRECAVALAIPPELLKNPWKMALLQLTKNTELILIGKPSEHIFRCSHAIPLNITMPHKNLLKKSFQALFTKDGGKEWLRIWKKQSILWKGILFGNSKTQIPKICILTPKEAKTREFIQSIVWFKRKPEKGFWVTSFKLNTPLLTLKRYGGKGSPCQALATDLSASPMPLRLFLLIPNKHIPPPIPNSGEYLA